MSVIVTGAARGIGRGVLDMLVARGRKVIAVDRDASPIAGQSHPGVEVVEADVTDILSIEEICARAGEISGVVACAGISRPGPSEDYPRVDWDSILALNLTAVFDLMRVAAKTAASGASFVAVSSVTASQGFAGRAAYAASKAGVEGLVRSLAVEYAPRIRVNSVVPGFIMTDIARANIALGVIDDATILSRTPMSRWGRPEDVAAAIGFLLDDASGWITGTCIPVDGGWLSLGLGDTTRD